jgi:alcohol dehydrogenase
VTSLRKGDRVLVPAITTDGQCDFCRRGMYSHCRNGCGVFGHRIHGLQFSLVESMTAYDVFSRAGETDALKVVLKAGVVASGMTPSAL